MKKVLIVASLFFATMLNAQSKFEGAMSKGLEQMKAQKTPAEIAETASFFERVADAEKTKWLPYYYAALNNYLGAWADPKADKDKVAEKCKDLITKAQAIENNADLYCLVQQVSILQLMVDPMSRWQTYGAVGKNALADAKKADATNPRIYYLEGMTTMNTPEAFGGGKAAAKPLFQKAVELYETYKLPTPFHPNWGKDEAAKALELCSK